MWGEGHTHANSKQDRIDLQKLHINLQLRHFKNTLLCISDDFAGHDAPGAHFPITDYAFSKGITIRDDSIFVQPPPNGWHHAEMAQLFWPNHRRHQPPHGLPTPVTQPGDCDVFLSIGKRDGTPVIAMPLPDDNGQGRYRIGNIRLEP